MAILGMVLFVMVSVSIEFELNIVFIFLSIFLRYMNSDTLFGA